MSLWGLARWWRESRARAERDSEPDSGFPAIDDWDIPDPPDSMPCPDTQPGDEILSTLPGRLTP